MNIMSRKYRQTSNIEFEYKYLVLLWLSMAVELLLISYMIDDGDSRYAI